MVSGLLRLFLFFPLLFISTGATGMCNEFCHGWMIDRDRNCNHTCWLPVLLPLEELLLLVMEGLAKNIGRVQLTRSMKPPQSFGTKLQPGERCIIFAQA